MLKTIYLFKMTDTEKFENLCDLTTNVLGLPQGVLSEKTRKQDIQVARSIAGVIARMEEEIHYTDIARVLNRDRSLIYHYEKCHSSNYSTWLKYRNAFNKVYTAYVQDSSNKRVFINKEWLDKHLAKNEVVNNPKGQVRLEIISGKITTIINTTYFDFTNQMELIKFALLDYDYKINIK